MNAADTRLDKLISKSRKYGFGVIVFSAFFMAALTTFFVKWHNLDSVNEAKSEARDYYKLNYHYREWNAGAGGVYAFTDKVEPNPHLVHPERDVTLADGRKLTLINPAYMTRMVLERVSRDSVRPIRGKLISLAPTNPLNAPNEWEAAALRVMEQHPSKEFSQLVEIDGQEYLQFLGPFVTESPCLKCHAKQGYQLGSLRGAISIAIPMAGYRSSASSLNMQFSLMMAVLWGGFSVSWGFLSRKRYENTFRLQLSEERNRTIFQAAQVGIFMADAAGAMTVANNQMADLLGVLPAELVGKPYLEFVHPDDKEACRDLLDQLARGSWPNTRVEQKHIRHDGSYFWGLVKIHRLVDENGNFHSFVGTISNTTERKQAEDALTHSNALMKYLIEHARSAVAVHDRELRYLYVSQRYIDDYNLQGMEIIGRHHDDVFPDWPRKWRDVHQRVLKGAVESSEEDLIQKPDGTAAWTRWECRPWYEANGSIGGIVVYTEDITARKNNELALAASDEWHSTVLKTAMSGIWTIDLQGNFLEANDTYCDMSGYRPEELLTMNVSHMEAHESAEDIAERIQAIVRLGASRFETRHRRKDGTVYDVEVGVKYLPVGVGRCIVFVNDITERKRAEAQLLRNKYALEKAQEIGRIGAWELDIVNDSLFWTDENCRIFGVPPGSIANYDVFINKVHPDDREYVNSEWQAAMGGRAYDIEHRLLIDGQTRWVREKARVDFDPSGHAVSAIGVTQDITDRKQLMDDYRRSAQLAALGTVAAGVAHEINNPIQGIINYATLIGGTPDRTERVVDLSERIIKEGSRIAGITRALLHCARDNQGEFRLTDILEPITTAISLVNLNHKHSGVGIELDLPASPVLVKANPQWIQQVIVNLVENSFDAVTARGEESESKVIKVIGRVVDEGGASRFRLDVLDYGIGIPAANLGKVRDAFFTTKQDTKGTGLGLSIVSDIIAKHQGELEIESEERGYTKVTVLLPMAK